MGEGSWGGGDSAVQPHSMGRVRGVEEGYTHTHRGTHWNAHVNVAPTL